MIEMYKGKLTCTADERQIEALEKAGWSREKKKPGPKPKPKPKAPPAPPPKPVEKVAADGGH